jgi:hypothetical protein
MYIKLDGEAPSRIRAWSLIHTKNPIVLNEKTSIRLRIQRPLHVQGDAGHPVQEGGGRVKNN